MNKKKIASLLLVGSLLIGGGVLGAKAWFTSNAQATSNLQITMGTLSVQAENDDKWAVDKAGVGDNETEVTNPEATNGFVNVRPGDSFTKTINVKNDGTLKMRATVKKTSVDLGELAGKVNITVQNGVEDLTNSGVVDIEPGKSAPVTINVELVGSEIGNDYQNGRPKHEVLQKFLNSNKTLVEIEGTQVNAK